MSFVRTRVIEVKQVARNATTDDTVNIMFSATFGEKFRCTEWADNGADADILYKCTLSQLQDRGVYFNIEDLPCPRTFDMAACNTDGNKGNILCTQPLTVDVELHIRHGTA